MARKVDVNDLVGTAEIARRLGVSHPQVVDTWRRRYDDFPQALVIIGGVRIWAWPDIEEWAQATGRAGT